jgi:S-formylglutathione hydrolase
MFETLKEHASFGGRQLFLRHQSTACRGAMELSLYLPPQAAREPVPVVYFLSGLTCTATNFTEKAGAQRLASSLGLAIVCPDTSPRGTGYPGEDADWDFGAGASFYVDATCEPWSETYQMYSYVTDELPKALDAEFPLAGEGHRSIFGHSMGGHGALVMALREPGRWRSVSAFAPICAPTRCPWGVKALGGYLGDDRDAWKAYDATELLRQRNTHPITILVDQGEADPFMDTQLKPQLLEEACAKAGQRLSLRRHAGYDHSYYFIASFLEDHLRHHAAALLGPAGAPSR